jgi:hypothetical protein
MRRELCDKWAGEVNTKNLDMESFAYNESSLNKKLRRAGEHENHVKRRDRTPVAPTSSRYTPISRAWVRKGAKLVYGNQKMSPNKQRQLILFPKPQRSNFHFTRNKKSQL